MQQCCGETMIQVHETLCCQLSRKCRASKMSAVKRPKALIKAKTKPKQHISQHPPPSKESAFGHLQRIFNTDKNRQRYQVQRCHRGVRVPFYCQMAEKRRHRDYNTFLSAYRQPLLLSVIVINRNGSSEWISPRSVAYQRLFKQMMKIPHSLPRRTPLSGLDRVGPCWTWMVCLQPNASIPSPTCQIVKACQG